MDIIVMPKEENLPTIQHVLTEGVALFPNLSRLKILRTWGGIIGYVHGRFSYN